MSSFQWAVKKIREGKRVTSNIYYYKDYFFLKDNNIMFYSRDDFNTELATDFDISDFEDTSWKIFKWEKLK